MTALQNILLRNLYSINKHWVLSQSLKLKSNGPAGIFHHYGMIRKISKCSANLSSSEQAQYEQPPANAHIFWERENSVLHEHFESWPEYKSTIFDKKLITSSSQLNSFRPLVQQMAELSKNEIAPPIMDPSLESLRNSITNEISSLNDENLFALLYVVSLLPKTRRLNDPDYKAFWSVLDMECVNRMKTWDYNTLFLVDDLLGYLKILRATNFHFQVVKKLGRKIHKLTKQQYVRFMFGINLVRSAPSFMSSYDLECSFQKYVEALTPEEIAIVCVSLFKTETKFQDIPTLEKIIDKTISVSTTLHGILVSGVAKFIRFSAREGLVDSILRFQNTFVPEIDRLDLSCSLHLALTGTTSMAYHKDIIDAVKQKFEQNLDTVRIKEIERFLLALTMFNHECTEFFEEVANEISKPHRVEELEMFGRSLPSILHYLAMKQVFVMDLINKVMDSDFLRNHYGRNMFKYQRELLCLDFAVGSDCPDYNGRRLDENLRSKIAKYYLYWTDFVKKERVGGHAGNIKDAVVLCTKILGGEKFLYVCNILPQYYTADLVFCLDENNQPVEVPEIFRTIPVNNIKWIPSELQNLTFHAVLLCNRNTCLHHTNVLGGNAAAQQRYLKKMGYILHTILPLDWQECQRFADKEQALLMDKVFNKVLNIKQLKTVNVSQ